MNLELNSRTCSCGTVLTGSVGEVTYKVYEKRITIYNIPHSYCQNCDLVYRTDETIKEILLTAYENNYNAIFWSSIVQ